MMPLNQSQFKADPRWFKSIVTHHLKLGEEPASVSMCSPTYAKKPGFQQEKMEKLLARSHVTKREPQ